MRLIHLPHDAVNVLGVMVVAAQPHDFLGIL
jgi:hypothetical protein